jgi:transcriptional regulator with XRE-family HTH domain
LDLRVGKNKRIRDICEATGISRQHYGRIESGVCLGRISFRIMGLIAKALSTSLDTIFEKEMEYLSSVGNIDDLSNY